MAKKALIAMSGGVDSSVAAALMCKAGYECVGATMKLYEHPEDSDPGEKACCTVSDALDARGVAYSLGMHFHVFNFTDDFAGQVIDRFVAAYERGDTPNPCIDCNRYMKFEKLYQRALLLGCDVIATGHYARVEQDPNSGRWLLKKSKNLAKDQSYVLYFLNQEMLAHTRFPLGEFETKEQVREIADTYGFENANKQESQDICFIPDGKYGDFMESYTGKTYPAGDFVTADGKVLGRHKGIIRYTIGQRKGLGLALPAPLYVCKKCMERNQVILTPESEIFTDTLIADEFNWIAYDAPDGPVRVTAMTRYHAKEAPAMATVLPDGRVQLRFDAPQRAVTTGQAVVLYDGDLVVGGGTITKAE